MKSLKSIRDLSRGDLPERFSKMIGDLPPCKDTCISPVKGVDTVHFIANLTIDIENNVGDNHFVKDMTL